MVMQSSSRWAKADRKRLKSAGLLECMQRPGEVVFVPPLWWHATSNVGDTVAVGAQSRKMGPAKGEHFTCAGFNHLVGLTKHNPNARAAPRFKHTHASRPRHRTPTPLPSHPT